MNIRTHITILHRSEFSITQLLEKDTREKAFQKALQFINYRPRSIHEVKEKLKDSHLLVLEFNHDERMLDFGPYPWELKQRIKGKRGHLSNDKAGDLLEMLLHDGLKYVILAHLSEINNHPEKAYYTANRVLKKDRRDETILLVAQQHKTSRFIELD